MLHILSLVKRSLSFKKYTIEKVLLMEEKKGKVILIVDDEDQIKEIIKTSLDLLGYRTACADDGVQALEEFKKQKFDLVISDIRMPNMNGLALLKAIKLYSPSTPMIMMSGYVLSPEQKDSLSSQADAYLTKPFSLHSLIKTVQNQLLETSASE